MLKRNLGEKAVCLRALKRLGRDAVDQWHTAMSFSYFTEHTLRKFGLLSDYSECCQSNS
jgi:hypothetical protein